LNRWIDRFKPRVRLTWQQAFIILASALVGAYAAGVLWYVQAVPEIGVHCNFRREVNRVYPAYLRADDGQPTPDVLGATVEQIGTTEVRTWPQLLRIVTRLEEAAYPDEGTDPSSLYVRRDGQPWVRLRLTVPPAPDPPPRVVRVWCQVGEPPASAMLPSLLWFALELCIFSVGTLVFWKRPHDRTARMFFVLSIVVIGAYVGGYHWGTILTQPLLLLVYMVCAVLLPAVSLHFYLLFPRPKRWLLARPGLTLAANYVAPTLFLAAIAAGYARVRWLSLAGGPPGEVEDALALVRQVAYAYFGVAALWYLASVVALLHSYRSARDAGERDQVRWILFGSLLATVPLGYSLYLALFEAAAFSGGGAVWPMFGASVCFTAAYGISITRHRLLRLDQLISSGMAYFLVSGLAALVYYVLVFLVMLVAGTRGVAGPSVEQAFWVSGSALVLTLVLDLFRSRLRRVLDRRYRRDRQQLDQTLQRLGTAVEQLVDPPTLARRLLQASAELMGTARGAVYLQAGDPPKYQLAGCLGESVPPAELDADAPLPAALLERDVCSVPADRVAAPGSSAAQLRALGGEVALALVHEGRLRAFLVLGPRPGLGYTPEDRALLVALAPISALALASAEGHRTIETLNRDLQAKVDKISEQQRRILTLQQQLTSLNNLDGQSGRAPAEPAADAPAGIVGSGPALRRVLELARKAAGSPSAVLIRGESGTGKELVARAVHDHSPRAGKAFVRVHCAALAPGLLESELFGHVKGAFTGAIRDKVGRFELADGGTLFLDEIGDISLDVQTKLLRVLQEHTFERVGSSEPLKVDVRLVAATHQPLEQLIRQGRFREDLFYRLNVITLTLPPLRERSDDVPELAQHFLKLHAQRCGKPVTQIDDDALVLLRAHRWPGNVRELENAIERAVVVADGPILSAADLPPELRRSAGVHLGLPARPLMSGRESGPRWGVRAEREARDAAEREALLRALEAAGGNKAEAARALGMARSTLVSRLKKHGLLEGRGW
jgi:transcriptional regulator with GAF, ATPase, and Fis domain